MTTMLHGIHGIHYKGIYEPMTVDGIPSVFPGGVSRRMFDIIPDDAATDKYMPITYQDGPICELCWLELGIITGTLDRDVRYHNYRHSRAADHYYQRMGHVYHGG